MWSLRAASEPVVSCPAKKLENSGNRCCGKVTCKYTNTRLLCAGLPEGHWRGTQCSEPWRSRTQRQRTNAFKEIRMTAVSKGDSGHSDPLSRHELFNVAVAKRVFT